LDDAVIQLLAIADFGEAGEVYHIASGQPVTMRELLKRELASHEIHGSIVTEGVGFSNRRGYDVPSIYADIRKTTALLNNRITHVTH
jgi:GDP-4-dehydro-6-deoxy-D-mannose reductase